MIDPDRITNYSRSDFELEEFILFCISVAGHNAHTTAVALENFLATARHIHYSPFEYIKSINLNEPFGRCLKDTLRLFGFGCYSRLARSFTNISISGLNLRTCSVKDLELIFGIGPKTARFFILHSRPDQNDIAVLDTHVLRYLESQGVKVPKSSPIGAQYLNLERAFLQHAKNIGIANIADFDLKIWVNGRLKPSAMENTV